MKGFIVLMIVLLTNCGVTTNKTNSEEIKKENLARSIKNLKNKKYCDSIGLTKAFELTNKDIIISKTKHNKIVSKYIELLPHKEIQIKKALKYNVPIELVILWNFQESSFKFITHNKNLNGDGAKDWGSLQINARGKNVVVVKYIENGDFEKYYEVAFKFMLIKKSKCIKTWFTNWNSRNTKQAIKYYDDFIKRTDKHNRDLRELI